MIPYFAYTGFSIFGLTVQAWGLLVSAGVVLAAFLILKLVKEYCLSEEVAIDIMLWLLLGGIIGSRIFYILFYAPGFFKDNPLEIFMVWHGGASSAGGFVGALLGGWLFMMLRGFKFKEILPYFDLTALGLWLGWAVGRLGCFLIHDHPGRLSNFFLAVDFPSGARHDLGLYDSLLALVVFIVFWILRKKWLKIKVGFVLYSSFAFYAIVRFFLDFLRAQDLPYSDVRYFNLTPAQWGALIYLLLLGIWWVWKRFKK